MIRDHSLNEDDLVRPHYSDEWQKTDTVVGLFSMAKRTPQPKPDLLPDPIETDHPASNEESVQATFYTLEEVARDFSSSSFRDSATIAGGKIPSDRVNDTQAGLCADESFDISNASSSVSTVIDEAAAAWDERHENSNASGTSSGTTGLQGGSLFGPIVTLFLLPWRFVLMRLVAIGSLLSRVGKLFEFNRAVHRVVEAKQDQSNLPGALDPHAISELSDLPFEEASDYAAPAYSESRTDFEGDEFQNMLSAADDIAADSGLCEAVATEGGMSAAISAASAAWDHRHAKPMASRKSVEFSPQHAGKLAAAGSWLIRLPWQMLLGVAFLIQILLSPLMKLIVSNRRVSQPIAIAVLIGIFYWIVSPMFVTQNQVYATLDQTFTEFIRLRSEASDEALWDRFRQRSLQKLTSFVPKLETDADVSDPASLSLLAVSRDYLPRLLNEQSRSSDEMEYKIRKHLKVAKTNLGSGGQSRAKSDFSMLLLISLNLGLVCAGIWFFARDRVFKAASSR